MIPFRSHYLVLPLYPVVMTLLFRQAPHHWGSLKFLTLVVVLLVIGFLATYDAIQQLRVDLNFARGSRRAARKYSLVVTRVVSGHLTISGAGRCLIGFTGGRRNVSFRLATAPTIARMWVEDETGHRFQERSLRRVRNRPSVVRNPGAAEHHLPSLQVCIPYEGPWAVRICFEIETSRTKETSIAMFIRVWGKCTNLSLANDVAVESIGAIGFPVVQRTG